MATYGSLIGVQAIVPAAGDFTTTSTPTSAEVLIWLAEGHALINQYLSAASYVVPALDTAEAYPTLTALNNLYAAAYVLMARGLDVVQGDTENRSEMMLKDFFGRLKMLAGQDLTRLGLILVASPLARRRRIRSLPVRRVDGYSAYWTGEPE